MTGQTSWTPPAGVAAAQPSLAPPPGGGGGGGGGGGLAPGWEERVDPATGRTFYIDHVNRRTAWDRPTASVGLPMGQPSYADAPSMQYQRSMGGTAHHIDSDAELARELAAQFQSDESGGGGGGGGSQMDSDAELARELAAQFDRDDAPPPSSSSSSSRSKGGRSSSSSSKGGKDDGKEGWAESDSATECFLTGTKFTKMVRKHHCRYCGQIFVNDVCKKTIKLPGEESKGAVRVCDVCYDQVERGDPVCLSRMVAKMRGDSKSAAESGARDLANWASMDPQFAHPQLVSACEQLRLAQSVSKLLGSSHSGMQSAGASLLGAMCQFPEHAELLESANVLGPLLSALRSSKTELKAKACSALTSLTSTLPGRLQLREAGGLGALMEVLLNGGSVGSSGGAAAELLEQACVVLANMCDSEGDDWREISQAGGVFALTGMIGSSRPSLQEASLTLLALLCSHNECRDQLADANCMPQLVRVLGSRSTTVQRTSLALCQQLCSSRKACERMLEAGAAAPLASTLSTSAAADVEVAVAVLECLEALSRVGVTQAQTAVRNAGAVPHLIQLMSHSHPRVQQLSSALVAELCPGDVHNAEQLYESGGLVMLADQLNSGDARGQLQALSALSQLSANPHQAGAIVENRCVPSILELLDHPSSELKSYAAITFGNLCSSGAIPQHQLEHPSVLPHLVSVLSSSNALAKGPAAGAIASMSSRPELRQTVFQLGGLPGLTALLSEGSDASYHAVQAVAQFAADEAFRTPLAETGALGALTPLLASHLPHVQQCALSALANVSFVPSAVGQLASSGALPQLGQMLFASAESGDGRSVLTALTNILAGAPSSAEGLVQVGGHVALLTQLSSPDGETQSQAAMAIGHMCRHPACLQALLQADTVPLLS
jgi:hypothetical protein